MRLCDACGGRLSLTAACYNRGCAPPPVGRGGSSQKGPASRAARVRSLQSRGRAVQAVKSGAKNADRQLANARKRVKATETSTNNDSGSEMIDAARKRSIFYRGPSVAQEKRIKAVQARGEAIKAMKKGSPGATAKLAQARDRVRRTMAPVPKGRFVLKPMDKLRTQRLQKAGIPYGAEGRKLKKG